MPPGRKQSQPRSYGRQREGRTIKSLSLDAPLVEWAEAQARLRGISFSKLIEEIIANERAGLGGIMEEPAVPFKAPRPKSKSKGEKGKPE